MGLYLRIFQHLLPRAVAWILSKGKTITAYFQGLTFLPSFTRNFFDLIWLDVFAAHTRYLDRWERELALPSLQITEDERRQRLAGRKQAEGGQDPAYLQSMLQERGFPAFVHEWYEVPAQVPAVPPVVRNPTIWLRDANTPPAYTTGAGRGDAYAGNEAMHAGRTTTLPGYLLVNNIARVRPKWAMVAGSAQAHAGNTRAVSGQFDDYLFDKKPYEVPTDPNTWTGFAYIGGETFGEVITVPAVRRAEFETLCLQLFPRHLWLGLFVVYN